jgi:hypothetical protein
MHDFVRTVHESRYDSFEWGQAEAMAMIDIADFEVSDQMIDKLHSHGIGLAQLYAVLDHFWVVTRNRRRRAASYLLFGTDDQGRCLTIPIVATDDPVRWRPITAWYCKPSEASILRRRRRF